MLVSLSEAKNYLRVDSSDDDEFIQVLIQTAEQLVFDVSRQINDYSLEENNIVRIAQLYTIAYLYEHREKANHEELVLTLRNLMFGVRREVF